MEASKVSTSKIFGIRPRDLAKLFTWKYYRKPGQDKIRVSLDLLRQHGYAEGLSNLLSTNLEMGILGDAADIKRRQKHFGVHVHRQPRFQDFQSLLCGNIGDSSVVVLIWAATAYLFVASFSDIPAYVEALSVYTGILFVSVIKAVCDWHKQKQVAKVLAEADNYRVAVYRQPYEDAVSIPVHELVVGDLVELQPGDRVPADCLLLEHEGLTVDESRYRNNSRQVEKEASQVYGGEEEEPDNHWRNVDPFLF